MLFQPSTNLQFEQDLATDSLEYFLEYVDMQLTTLWNL